MADSNGTKTLVALWALTIIPLVFMLLRFYCKSKYSKPYGYDDMLLVGSWILSLLYTVFAQVSVGYGIGRHFNDIEDKAFLVVGVKYMYISEIFGMFSVPMSKASFCVTLLRLTIVPWQRQILWFILITINLVFWAGAILTLVQCEPKEKLWNFTLDGKCWDNRIVIYFCVFIGVYSTLMDFLLALCPWLIIHKLQMRKREKFNIIAAMSLGCLAGIACAVKTAYLPLIGTWADFTYNIGDVLIWAITESAITIVAASIPFLRPMMKYISSRGGSRGPSNGYTESHKLDDRLGGSRSLGTKVNIEAQPASNGIEGDDDSDKSILRETRDSGKITKTREVTVAYSESGDESTHDGRRGNS
ncbi:hypothetical protein EKO04_002643 [Ascochyta lentis]|uniref:Rhodopsin domain-containing protein n=1 Tax=Ascochyta lentis TaxID=205686 RepID=A0A8H7JAK6_9PLEO|nr:hypothetical protein EKO04_002643 [Ascochyta lentis]